MAQSQVWWFNGPPSKDILKKRTVQFFPEIPPKVLMWDVPDRFDLFTRLYSYRSDAVRASASTVEACDQCETLKYSVQHCRWAGPMQEQ